MTLHRAMKTAALFVPYKKAILNKVYFLTKPISTIVLQGFIILEKLLLDGSPLDSSLELFFLGICYSQMLSCSTAILLGNITFVPVTLPHCHPSERMQDLAI